MIISSDFKPAWFLKNQHLQTIYSSLVRKRIQAPVDYSERLELPDGDFLDLVWSVKDLSADTPLVIFLHGLGGDINSSYVASQIVEYNNRGWRAVFMHFRGASGVANRKERAYHSGETQDLHYLLQELKLREPNTKKAIVGISIGGNVLLKWLGENARQDYIDGAVAVSVPFVLNKIASKINSGFAKVYQMYLLRKMRALFAKKIAAYPDLFVKYTNPIFNSRTLWDFDNDVTAPMYGFRDADDYYEQSSSRQYLQNILTPTLIIHALDDPFMTRDVVPKEDELGKGVILELSKKGGHVGFVASSGLGKINYWLDLRIPEYLQTIF